MSKKSIPVSFLLSMGVFSDEDEPVWATPELKKKNLLNLNLLSYGSVTQQVQKIWNKFRKKSPEAREN